MRFPEPHRYLFLAPRHLPSNLRLTMGPVSMGHPTPVCHRMSSVCHPYTPRSLHVVIVGYTDDTRTYCNIAIVFYFEITVHIFHIRIGHTYGRHT